MHIIKRKAKYFKETLAAILTDTKEDQAIKNFLYRENIDYLHDPQIMIGIAYGPKLGMRDYFVAPLLDECMQDGTTFREIKTGEHRFAWYFDIMMDNLCCKKPKSWKQVITFLLYPPTHDTDLKLLGAYAYGVTNSHNEELTSWLLQARFNELIITGVEGTSHASTHDDHVLLESIDDDTPRYREACKNITIEQFTLGSETRRLLEASILQIHRENKISQEVAAKLMAQGIHDGLTLFKTNPIWISTWLHVDELKRLQRFFEKLDLGWCVEKEIITRKLFETKVEDTHLTERVKNVLHDSKMNLDDLYNTSEQYMLKLRKFGKKSLVEVIQFFDEYGLTWPKNN